MSDERHFLIFGGSGQLGTALVSELESRGAPVAAPSRSEVDLLCGDLASALVRWSPAAVIYAAAYNDVNGAELEANRNEVFRLNRDAPAELARACAGRGLPFVHVSTDYVFDGAQGEPYREDDPTRPLQVYGRSKLAGEGAVLAADPDALVVRTSTLFGASRRNGSNFVRAVLTRARTEAALDVVRLPISSPTYAADLARALLHLSDAGARGLVHVTNAGGCTRLELAVEAIRVAGLAGRVAVRERAQPPAGAPRPAYSILDTTRYAALTGRSMRPWRETLQDYVAADWGQSFVSR
jgi:dTDP-4-dehydrorhamnose reductase